MVVNKQTTCKKYVNMCLCASLYVYTFKYITHMHTQTLPVFFFFEVPETFSTGKIQIKLWVLVLAFLKRFMWNLMTKEVERKEKLFIESYLFVFTYGNVHDQLM